MPLRYLTNFRCSQIYFRPILSGQILQRFLCLELEMRLRAIRGELQPTGSTAVCLLPLPHFHTSIKSIFFSSLSRNKRPRWRFLELWFTANTKIWEPSIAAAALTWSAPEVRHTAGSANQRSLSPYFRGQSLNPLTTSSFYVLITSQNCTPFEPPRNWQQDIDNHRIGLLFDSAATFVCWAQKSKRKCLSIEWWCYSRRKFYEWRRRERFQRVTGHFYLESESMPSFRMNFNCGPKKGIWVGGGDGARQTISCCTNQINIWAEL